MKRVPSNNTPSMRKPIITSAIVHATILISLIVIPGTGLMMSDRPIKINVTWVELPRGTSEEIDFGMKKSKGLPKSTIEEQRRLFEPKGTQTPLKPKMKAPVTAKKETQKKPAPRPKIKASKKSKFAEHPRPTEPSKAHLQKSTANLKNARSYQNLPK